MTRYILLLQMASSRTNVALCTGAVVQELLTSWLWMLFGQTLLTTASSVSDLHVIVLQGLRYLVLQPVLLMLFDCRTLGGSFRFCATLDDQRGCSFDVLSVSQLFVSDMSRMDDSTTPATCFPNLEPCSTSMYAFFCFCTRATLNVTDEAFLSWLWFVWRQVWTLLQIWHIFPSWLPGLLARLKHQVSFYVALPCAARKTDEPTHPDNPTMHAHRQHGSCV